MRNLKKWAAALSLLLSLMLAMPLCAAAETKSEVVYANLKSTGAVRRVAVVNKFDLDKAGQITDYGMYESLTNLTNLTPLAASGDTVTAKADAGSFYYEGVLASCELPWDITVTCTLDGQPVSPEALGGKSGHLQMAIDVRKNPKGNPVYLLLKCEGSPHVYALEAGKKRWIVDIPTFVSEGFVWEDVQQVPCTELRKLPDGESIPAGRGTPPPPLP
jgi:hypothetical protein